MQKNGMNMQKEELLVQREQRAAFQQELLQDDRFVLITIKANFPGSNKHNPHTTMVVVSIMIALKERFAGKIKKVHTTNTLEGYIVFLLIEDDPQAIKETCIALEDSHPLGRLADIDVISKTKMYARSNINVPPRSCFLCACAAHVCARAQTHTHKEVTTHFEHVVEYYAKKDLAQLVTFALLAEASAYPKFGLVTPFTSGSHDDMDFDVFVRSIVCIAPRIAQAISQSRSCPEIELFSHLRTSGIAIEKAMMETTGGINTHKGAIFLFLLVLGAWYRNPDRQKVSETIANLSRNLQNDFERIGVKHPYLRSHGEVLYDKYGLQGVRGLAMRGMPEVFHDYVVFYEQQCGAINERLVKTLLYIMETCEDTTIVHRGGMDALFHIQCIAKEIRLKKRSQEELEAYCRKHKLSAGGSADLLALVVLVSFITKEKMAWL